MRYALVLGFSLAVLQQVTGINTVIYYGPHIFQLAGIASNVAAILATTLVGVVNVLLTLVAIFFVDRIGRKPLLYAGMQRDVRRACRAGVRVRAAASGRARSPALRLPA